MRKVFYFFIILMPSLLLLFFLIVVGVGVHKIRNLDYKKIHSQLQKYLEQEKGNVSISVKNDQMIINYAYHLEQGPYKPAKRKINLAGEADDYVVYAYGSSPIISKPPFFKGEFGFFPSILERKLKNDFPTKNVKVLNFGMSSFDTFDIKQLITLSLAHKKPDIIIYYDSAATDFSNAYFTAIKPYFYFVWNILAPKNTGSSIVALLNDWFLRTYIEPYLINTAQKIGLIQIQPQEFNEFNQRIFYYYKKNIYDIINIAKKYQTPLIIVSSICNLETRPYGIPSITDTLYAQGQREKEYNKRIEYLSKAKNSEIFTIDIGGPQSQIRSFLNNINTEGVYVLDLHKELQKIQFDFNYRYFYDVGHMRPKLHAIIADLLYKYLNKNSLIQ